MTALNEKVAVVTGAASGIGAALAEHAKSLGMNLVLADIDVENLSHSWADRDRHLVFQTNVAERNEVFSLADAAYTKFGRVDYLFNNAGILRSGRSWELAPADWESSYRVNVGGVVNGIQAFVPRMISSGLAAVVVNTASVGGFFSAPLMAPYSASKFAVVAITEALERDLREQVSQVRAAVLAPGPVKTGLLASIAKEESSELISKMIHMTEKRGVDPSFIAGFTFAALEEGKFWIVPQPESLDDRVKQRTASILGRNFD